jgi:phage gp46-like protein
MLETAVQVVVDQKIEVEAVEIHPQQLPLKVKMVELVQDQAL